VLPFWGPEGEILAVAISQRAAPEELAIDHIRFAGSFVAGLGRKKLASPRRVR